MHASQPNNSTPIDQSFRGGGWIRVASIASVVGFGIVLGAVKLGPLFAAILAALALGATSTRSSFSCDSHRVGGVLWRIRRFSPWRH